MGKQDKGLIQSNPNLTQIPSDLMRRRAGIMLREHMIFFWHIMAWDPCSHAGAVTPHVCGVWVQ